MTNPGVVLAGRYTLLREAWRTDRGEVWQARDGTLDRRVHVMLLGSRFLEDRAARRAFVDEAATHAASSDPSLAAVYDIGTDPPFVVFEDPGGGRLVDRLRSGPLEASFAARVAANVARGIQALEARAEPVPAISADAVLLSTDGRGKLVPLASQTSTNEDVRHALARLTVRMFTGSDPVDGRVPRREIPGPIADLLVRMLDRNATPPPLDAFVDACGQLARPKPAEERGVRKRSGARGDLGWLFGVVVIVALAIVAVVLGPGLIESFNERNPASPEPTSSADPAAGEPIPIEDVADFDPLGNGEEHPDEVGRAIDGDPLSSWTTLGYKQATMDKPGVGLLVDLGTSSTVSALRIQTSLAGWRAQIRASDELPEGPDDLDLVTSFTAGSDTTVTLPEGTSARYLLVWITRLADDAGESDFPFRASVSELRVLG